MVIYDLICDSNHEFEGWFKNADDLVSQRESGLLTCPYCDSGEVIKKLAAPKISKKSNATNNRGNQEVAIGGIGDTQSPEKFQHLQKMLGEVHNFIDKNFEDVGNRFADEAISIHQGEKEATNIRGTASAEQIKEMAEQGVEAVPLPPKPIDRKKIN
jgi:hypothetical protein